MIKMHLAIATLLLRSGCTIDSRNADTEVARQLAANEQRAGDAHGDPMRPMRGAWVVDLEATLDENPSMPEYKKEAIRKNPASQRFELTISESDYISRSLMQTSADRYTVRKVDGSSVTIALSSTDGVERDADREATLRLRDGKLLITTRGPAYGTTTVMSRPATGGG